WVRIPPALCGPDRRRRSETRARLRFNRFSEHYRRETFMGMADTLVLDLANRPIGFVSWQRAVKMYWEDRAEIVKEDPLVILHSPSIEMNMPRVIKAKNYVVKRMKLSVPFSR